MRLLSNLHVTGKPAVLPDRAIRIQSHYSIYRPCICGKNVLDMQMHVLISPEFLFKTFFCSNRYWASWGGSTCRSSAYRYSHVHYFHTFSGKTEVSWQLFVKFFGAKFHKNPFVGFELLHPDWRMEQFSLVIYKVSDRLWRLKSSLIRQGKLLTVVNICGLTKFANSLR